MWMTDKELKELVDAIIASGKDIDVVANKIAINNYKLKGKSVSLRKLIYMYHQEADDDNINFEEFLADC